MMFNSLQYLVFVLVAVAAFWALLRAARARNAMLMGASWLFYMSWNPYYIWIIATSTVVDYLIGLALERQERPGRRKLLVTASVVSNLGLMGLFKYYDFFVTATGDSLRWVHARLDAWGAVGDGAAWMLTATDGVPLLQWVLPVGISFYTFQTMSYTIDVYRRKMPATRDFIQFGAYVAFFPQLVAGPIVRAAHFLPQLARPPRLDQAMVGRGLFLIGAGLVKKVAIADYLAVHFVDRVFENPAAFTSVEAMMALYGYTVQIYCDFSGYSDVAIGTGMLMGFRLPENFDRPYQSRNPAEFWRRWHMTLSTWLRDYLYFPLGGSRKGATRTYLNLFLTLFLIGIWHGASWTFVWYGLMHATAVVLHRAFYKWRGRPGELKDGAAMFAFKVALMFHFTVLSRILFRAPDMATAGSVWDQLLVGSTSTAQITWGIWALMFGAMALHWTPKRWITMLSERFVAAPAWAQGLALALVGWALMALSTGEVVPYIYLQF